MSQPDVPPAENTDETGAASGEQPLADSSEQLRSAGEQVSSAVLQAADVLESELSGGIGEARRLQSKFTEQRRLEPGDLDELATRVRRSAHDLIDVLTERFHDLGAQDVQDLAGRFSKDAHSVLDGMMDLVDVVPDVVNRLVERADKMLPNTDTGVTDTTVTDTTVAGTTVTDTTGAAGPDDGDAPTVQP